jgi:hypothetical protein
VVAAFRVGLGQLSSAMAAAGGRAGVAMVESRMSVTEDGWMRRRGSLHHLELWMDDATRVDGPWPWLLRGLGYTLDNTWTTGQSWINGDAYLVLESGPAHVRGPQRRLRSGMNHVAWWAGTREEVEALVVDATQHGWSLCSLTGTRTLAARTPTPPIWKTPRASRSNSSPKTRRLAPDHIRFCRDPGARREAVASGHGYGVDDLRCGDGGIAWMIGDDEWASVGLHLAVLMGLPGRWPGTVTDLCICLSGSRG